MGRIGFQELQSGVSMKIILVSRKIKDGALMASSMGDCFWKAELIVSWLRAKATKELSFPKSLVFVLRFTTDFSSEKKKSAVTGSEWPRTNQNTSNYCGRQWWIIPKLACRLCSHMCSSSDSLFWRQWNICSSLFGSVGGEKFADLPSVGSARLH